MADVNPELVQAIISALQSTPEFVWLKRRLEEDAAAGPVKHSHRPDVERYEARLGAAALSIHTDAARQGKQLSFDECRDKAIARCGPAPVQVERFAMSRAAMTVHDLGLRFGRSLNFGQAMAIAERVLEPDKYEEKISEEAVRLHGEAAGRGERLTYDECRRRASSRLAVV